VVGYLRVSTGAQVAGHGLDAQRDAIEVEAARRGWDVTWVQDPGASARSLERPGVQYAPELLRQGQADALVVSKLDRLSRSLSDFAMVMETMRAQQWKLVALDMNIDMATGPARRWPG